MTCHGDIAVQFLKLCLWWIFQGFCLCICAKIFTISSSWKYLCAVSVCSGRTSEAERFPLGYVDITSSLLFLPVRVHVPAFPTVFPASQIVSCAFKAPSEQSPLPM